MINFVIYSAALWFGINFLESQLLYLYSEANAYLTELGRRNENV